MNAGPATTDIAARAVGIGAADEPKGQAMTNPDELERAAGNLAGLARDLERFDPWGGTRSKSDALTPQSTLQPADGCSSNEGAGE